MGVHNLSCPANTAGVTLAAPLGETLIDCTFVWLGE
jgi:hypothetical protein